mgnify:CR=1 FL=1
MPDRSRNRLGRQYGDRVRGVQYQGKRYLVHGDTVTETQKAMNELRYKQNRVKAGTYYRQK